jgi:FSR family fosmidomycin resistance protein-like MFS transporter
MDTDPSRHDHNMARWTLAGSIGVVAGPLILAAAVALGSGWRGMYGLFAVLALLLVAIAARFRFPNGAAHEEEGERQTFIDGLRGALRALRRKEVLRWLVLLEFADLMMDVLYGFLALYFVDAAGLTPTQAGLAVAVWTVCGLIGDALLIPLLERVDGVAYLRWSAVIEGALYLAFLLIPGIWPKLIALGLLGFFNSGWYAILQGRLYSAMPGQSGAVTTVGNVAGLIGSVVPLALGFAAERAGIGAAMWLLVLGPIALIIGLPRHSRR